LHRIGGRLSNERPPGQDPKSLLGPLEVKQRDKIRRMLGRRRSSEQVATSCQRREIETSSTPLTVPAPLHAMRLVENDVRWRLRYPASKLLIARCEPLVVDDRDFGGRRPLPKERDSRRRGEANLDLLEPRFKRTQRSYHEHLANSATLA
jgi:hypothetical protein